MSAAPSIEDLISPLNLAITATEGRIRRAPHLNLLEYEVLETLQPNGWDILIAQAPPRHGKTEFLAKAVPTWFHSVYPTKQSMILSYGLDLARKSSRYVRDEVHRIAPWFGHAGVSKYVATATDWEMANGLGGMKAAGIGGGITGRGADLMCIDDYLKNSEQAVSDDYREKQWEWFQTTAFSRIEPGGKLIVLACMTGDTLVDMADGSRLEIKNIRPGHEVLTFREGSLCKSFVKNHAMVGKDLVFRLTLESGRTATANLRHPFLIENKGELKWERLRSLTTGSKIVTRRVSGANGAASLACGISAMSPQNAEATAIPITCKSAELMATDHRLITQNRTVEIKSNIATELRSNNTTRCSKDSAAYAQYASNHQRPPTCESIKETYWSTIATKQSECEDCFAITAISQQDTLGPTKTPLDSLDISEFMLDKIVSIEQLGFEEVFDIEVSETESFIANGLVSHNTRWHEDDLIGRLLKFALEDNSLRVREIRLPALAEPTDAMPDPLGRKTDEALWPDRVSQKYLMQRRAILEPYWWNAVYQQRLGSYGRNEWPPEYFYGILANEDEWPENPIFSATALDPSKGKAAKAGDFSAIVNVAYSGGYLWVDCDIERRPVPQMMLDLVSFNDRIRPTVTGIEAVAFQELLAQDYIQAQQEAGTYRDDPELIDNSINKELRIARIGLWLRLHRIKIRRNRGGLLLLEQLKGFPNAKHDDGPDALEMAIRILLRVCEELQMITGLADPSQWSV